MAASTRQLLNQVFPKMKGRSAAVKPSDAAEGQLRNRHTDLRNREGDVCNTLHPLASSAVFSRMLPQPQLNTVFRDAAFAAYNAAVEFEPQALPAQITLPFQRLKPFADVADQFSLWGVHFEAAIALNPSNPAFYSHQSRRGIMPRGQGQSLDIRLRQTHEQVTLQVRGYGDFRVRVLDAEGHDLGVKAFSRRLMEQHKAPVEQLTIALGHGQRFILDSTRPFILESFQL